LLAVAVAVAVLKLQLLVAVYLSRLPGVVAAAAARLLFIYLA
jgi:hypothetical protein